MLTPCIQNIFRDALPSKPTVQIIEIKQIATAANGEAPTRIKCVPHSHPNRVVRAHVRFNAWRRLRARATRHPQRTGLF